MPTRTPVVLPDLGAAPICFSLWLADPGEHVYAGDRVAEVLAAGATFDVSSPVTGRLVEQSAWPRDPLRPGQVLGIVEEEDKGIE
jgi:2-oxoglutarate dehydrogenase E2 component (dihydrolipoamide succinyltransferase)/2-oxoisovalerate dehydrogenase E2 component (dihydrolipoyl transacylase)